MVTEHYQDGSPCECDSMVRKYYDSGELESETPYVDGKIHGKQMEYEPFAKFNPQPSAEDRMHWVEKYEVPYENGSKQGIGYGYYLSGIVAVENHFANDLWFCQKIFYPSGALEYECAYRNESKHGTGRVYYETGELAEERPYVAGKLHGIRVIHHGKTVLEYAFLADGHGPYDFPDAPEGMVTRIAYVDGVRHGLETTHYPDGTLFYEVEWKDGKRVGKGKTYDPDGSLSKETIYRYAEDIHGYSAVDIYVSGEMAVIEALNHWYMPRRKQDG